MPPEPFKKAVFFDLETGGLKPEMPIIQIGAVAIDVKNWTVLEQFERKLRFNPDTCEPKALEVNSYSRVPEAWKDAVDPTAALAQFCNFLDAHATENRISERGNGYKVAKVGGHNIVGFDLKHFHGQALLHGIRFVPWAWTPCLDTMHGAAWFFAQRPEVVPPKNYQLTTLAKYFNIEMPSAHDAVDDARASAALARRFLG